MFRIKNKLMEAWWGDWGKFEFPISTTECEHFRERLDLLKDKEDKEDREDEVEDSTKSPEEVSTVLPIPSIPPIPQDDPNYVENLIYNMLNDDNFLYSYFHSCYNDTCIKFICKLDEKQKKYLIDSFEDKGYKLICLPYLRYCKPKSDRVYNCFIIDEEKYEDLSFINMILDLNFEGNIKC